MKLFKRKQSDAGVRVALSLEGNSFHAVELVSLASAGIEIRAFSNESCSVSEELEPLLERWILDRQLADSRCVNVLPLDTYQLVQADLGALPQEERRQAARWQIRELIDFPPQEAVVDLFEIPSFSGDKAAQTYVVAAHEKFLRQQLQVLGQADLVVSAIDLPEFALRNICNLFPDERGLAMLLLLEGRGLLVVVRDSVLYLVRALGVGMNRLAAAADGGLEALADALDPVVLEIQRSFDFCESTFRLPLVGRLLVAQTGREIPALTNYLNDSLAANVEPFCFPDNVKVPENVTQLELNSFLVQIGGALRQEQS